MRDADDILIDELNGPPPLDVCREALEFWTRRRRSLSLMRRSARRDAAEMIARWEARLRAAEAAERANKPWRQVLDALGITWPAVATRLRLPSRRRVTVVAGGAVVALSACLVAVTVLCLALAYAVLTAL